MSQQLITVGSFFIQVMDLSKPLHWVKIFSSLQVAEDAIELGFGKTVYLKKYDLRIALIRGMKGWLACQDNCPHRGVSLGTGWVNEANEIVCPLHHYAWSLDTGKETTNFRCSDVILYPVKTNTDGLFIGLVLN